MVLYFFLKFECNIKLNKVTNMIRYSGMDQVVVYPYPHPFIFDRFGY